MVYCCSTYYPDFIMKLLNYLTIFLSAFILSACASAPKADLDPNIDFSQYKSFAWEFSENNKQRKVSDPVYDSPLFEKKLEKAVAEAMIDQGFTGSDEPDMVLSYHLADQKRRNYPVDISLGYGRYSRHSYWSIFAPHLHSLERNEVLVIVDATDANTDELIWRGWTKTRKRSTPLSMQEVYRLADKIMSAFPR